MNVVGHDDVSANSPSMPIMCRAPFINKNFGDFIGGKKFPAILRARCYEIDRCINPNALQPAQVFVHIFVVADGGDLDNLRRSYADDRGRRPRLQHQR